MNMEGNNMSKQKEGQVKIKEMESNVIGLVGITAKNAALNKDFDSNVRTNGKGDFIATKYCNKYLIRNAMDKNEKNVVFYRKFVKEDGTVGSIDDKYKKLFDKDISEDGIQKATYNLLSCIDVINTGIAYAGAVSISIMGAVQLTDAVNKNNDCIMDIHDINSQFHPGKKNTKKDKKDSKNEAKQATLGKTVVTDDAHYFYSFTINPSQYNKYKETLKEQGFKGYTDKAYSEFKEAVLTGATLYNSSSKAGCQNEFGMFIEFKKGFNPVMGDLTDYIKFYYEDEQAIIDISTIKEIIQSGNIVKEIQNVEIYFNPYTTKLRGEDIKGGYEVKIYNLITREEVSKKNEKEGN